MIERKVTYQTAPLTEIDEVMLFNSECIRISDVLTSEGLELYAEKVFIVENTNSETGKKYLRAYISEYGSDYYYITSSSAVLDLLPKVCDAIPKTSKNYYFVFNRKESKNQGREYITMTLKPREER